MTDPQQPTATDDVEGHGRWNPVAPDDDPDTDDVEGHGRIRLHDEDGPDDVEGHAIRVRI